MRRAWRALAVCVGIGALPGVAGAQQQPAKRLPDLERGEELYLRHCVQCHGVTGAGDGPATAALVAPVPDLRGGVEKSDLDEIAKIVLAGRGAMPAFEMSFDRYDARRALRYLDKIGRGEVVTPEEAPAAPEDDEDEAE